MARQENASYEKAGQRTPKSIGDMQKEITELKGTIAGMQQTISGIIGSVDKISKNYVTLSGKQTLTNKKYNGMQIYRVSVNDKKTIYIKNTSAVPGNGAHVGGFLFMEQNGESLIAVLKPNGWTVLANGANWSCSYSNYQWTISAQSWSYGWFIPFSDDMNFTITYG